MGKIYSFDRFEDFLDLNLKIKDNLQKRKFSEVYFESSDPVDGSCTCSWMYSGRKYVADLDGIRQNNFTKVVLNPLYDIDQLERIERVDRANQVLVEKFRQLEETKLSLIRAYRSIADILRLELGEPIERIEDGSLIWYVQRPNRSLEATRS